MVFLELRQEPGVYSRVTAGMAIRNSTCGAGGKLAQIFNQRLEISSHLGTIWGAWSFPRVAVLILIFIWT